MYAPPGSDGDLGITDPELTKALSVSPAYIHDAPFGRTEK